MNLSIPVKTKRFASFNLAAYATKSGAAPSSVFINSITHEGVQITMLVKNIVKICLANLRRLYRKLIKNILPGLVTAALLLALLLCRPYLTHADGCKTTTGECSTSIHLHVS